MTMKGYATIALASVGLALLAGCGGVSEKQAKVQAYERWYEARARVLVGVGEERFKTGDLDAARTNAQEALALAPNMPEAQLLMARVSIEKGSYDEAEQWLQKAATRFPQSGQIAYLLGVVHEKRGQLDAALAAYEKARALEPNNGAHVLAAAEVLVSLDRPEEALALVEAKLTSTEHTLAMYRAAGELAMLVQQPGRAAEHFALAGYLAPDDLSLQESRAKALYFAGRYEDAVGVLGDLRGQGDYDRRAWLHTMLGDCALAMRQPRDARASFERAAELEPAVARHWVNLAKAALAADDVHRTVLAAGEALRLDPQQADASLLLGYALLAQGQAGKANQVLRQAVQFAPDQAALQCLLGRSYGAIGDGASAEACYRAALALEPEHPVAMALLAQAQPR